jgi:poly(3-hydroxybutyrate) depolymerase
MGSWTRTFIMRVAALLAAALAAETVAAQEEDLAKRFLRAAEGLQMPGSEADSFWWFVSYPGEEELPTAERMASLEGCADYPEGVMRRLDFDATFDSLGSVQPWMDRGQKKSARGFARLSNLFHRQFGDDLAVYRCDTNKYGEVRIYFLGLSNEGLSGLKTINIET